MLDSSIAQTFGSKLSQQLDTKVTLLAFEGSIISFLFGKGSQVPVAVAKMSANPELNKLLRSEYQNLLAAGTVPCGAGIAFAPKGLGEGEWRSHYFFLQEYVCGSMLSSVTELDAQWWQKPGKVARMQQMCDLLIEFQAKTCSLSAGIGTLGFADDLACYRKIFSLDAGEEELISGLESYLEQLQHERVPLVACHGDFSANNLLQSQHGLRVLDWRYFLDRYHPIFDVTIMCFAFLGSFEGTRWQPVWEGRGNYAGLVQTAELFLRKVARYWDLDPEVVRLLVQLSCVSLTLRGFRDSGVVRARDEGWRKSLSWLALGDQLQFS